MQAGSRQILSLLNIYRWSADFPRISDSGGGGGVGGRAEENWVMPCVSVMTYSVQLYCPTCSAGHTNNAEDAERGRQIGHEKSSGFFVSADPVTTLGRQVS